MPNKTLSDLITGAASCCIQRQHRLHGHVSEGNVETLEHDLHHPLTVVQGVHGCLRQQHRVILWIHTQLLERVVPDLEEDPDNKLHQLQFSRQLRPAGASRDIQRLHSEDFCLLKLELAEETEESK